MMNNILNNKATQPNAITRCCSRLRLFNTACSMATDEVSNDDSKLLPTGEIDQFFIPYTIDKRDKVANWTKERIYASANYRCLGDLPNTRWRIEVSFSFLFPDSKEV
ncbi:hypothetical protein T4B_5930 [Trichinella pseudospiralis]|uniref:Uncharacterized protein n=1 Tax=Trichinella pseudospiralis TaxID=6337 RepID=A0A0V0XTY3_TRIPS|nr:hypothetical protein T4E_7340 [Trichinella pseudospiralis]KRY69444.1 hypothetical protein T4A_4593 [Trichinella pseudospiralis]KRZ28245.1 hypothetical protein T4B_5930 [Trichinella pseudospiralis]